MMIEEIPIEITSEPSDNIEEAVPEVKKSRGRPKGVINKKEKPVIKVKKVKVKEIIESESEEEVPKKKKKVKPVESDSEEEKPKKRKKVTEEERPQYSTHDIASEVISMLSNRHLDRRLQKRDKYRSWFQ
jgi:hypothetical protein